MQSSGVDPQDSSSLTDIKSQSLDASELGSQAPAEGIYFPSCGVLIN